MKLGSLSAKKSILLNRLSCIAASTSLLIEGGNDLTKSSYSTIDSHLYASTRIKSLICKNSSSGK